MKIKQIGAGLLAALMILTVAGCKPSDDPVSDSSLSESGSTDPSGETGPGTDSTTDPLGTDGSDPTNPDSSSGSGSTASRPPVTTTSPVVVEPTDSNFVITKDGAAKACIVIPSSPSKKVKTAAEDLQAVLEQITGAKLEKKKYYHHSGYVGGLREITLDKLLAEKPADVLMHAVRGMLPKNRLGRAMLKKLKVYAGPTHPHTAQGPKPLSFPY